MIEALNKKGYNGYALSVPSSKEFLTVLGLAAPVFVTMMSKVTIPLYKPIRLFHGSTFIANLQQS